MPLETGTFIPDLVTTNPADTDSEAQGSNHLRLIKACIKNTFPNFTDVALASTQAQIDAAVSAALAGTFSLAAGSAAAPALALVGDSDTGVWSAGAGKIDITIEGTNTLEINTTGLNLIAGTLQFGGTNVFPLPSSAYGAGSILTAALGASQVTYAKLQNEGALSLLGNPTGSAATPSEITLGAGLSFSGATLFNSGVVTLYAPNLQILLSGTALTYTTPTNGGNLPLYLKVKMVGSGGGTTAGTDTSFGGWSAAHGGASATGNGGAGGTGGTTGTGTLIRRIAGQAGSPTTGSGIGGTGGISSFGGGAKFSNTSQFSPAANSGSGSSDNTNGGGGAGEYVEFVVPAPAASYTYTVGASGTNGSAGRIEVEAHWQ